MQGTENNPYEKSILYDPGEAGKGKQCKQKTMVSGQTHVAKQWLLKEKRHSVPARRVPCPLSFPIWKPGRCVAETLEAGIPQSRDSVTISPEGEKYVKTLWLRGWELSRGEGREAMVGQSRVILQRPDSHGTSVNLGWCSVSRVAFGVNLPKDLQSHGYCFVVARGLLHAAVSRLQPGVTQKKEMSLSGRGGSEGVGQE